MTDNFSFSRTPELHFGSGSIDTIPSILQKYGSRALVVIGNHVVEDRTTADRINALLFSAGIRPHFVIVSGEPSPESIDSIVRDYGTVSPDSVCAIGGGSVIDTGKAVSAMFGLAVSVFDFLEGVGGAVHSGRKLPFIAVPTTAGTGSEATKNAVLSRVGENGFKKSLRHDNFVPDCAVIDPWLALSCPPQVTASSGMDALCQLLESYVSTKALPMTDALAESGLMYAGRSLLEVSTGHGNNLSYRSDMAYAAYLSGITLANAGLGAVHGFASSIGGMFGIPHGVICGTLLAETTGRTIERCRESDSAETARALKKYAAAGRILTADTTLNDHSAVESLENLLHEWTVRLAFPRLGDYGVTDKDVHRIVMATSAKYNPGGLETGDLRAILENSLMRI